MMFKEKALNAIPLMRKKKLDKNKVASITSGKFHKDKSAEEELPYNNIIEDIIKIDQGKYRIIAMTNAISIDDMNEEDQEVVLSIYGEWLNGLTKAYQTYIPSFTLDIRDHLNRLELRAEEDENSESWLMDDMEFQKELIEEFDIIDTQFYFTFQTDFKPSDSEEKDFLKAKKELARQFKFASDELESIGLYLKRLNKKEIGKLLYYSLNPFSAGVQEPDFDDNLVAGIKLDKDTVKSKTSKNQSLEEEDQTFKIKEKNTNHLAQGTLSFKEKIAPYSINDKESGEYIKVGSTYMTVYEVYDYPKNMPVLWARKLYKFRDNIDISIHTKPIKTSEIVKELDKASVNYGGANIDSKTGKKKKATTMMDKKMEDTAEDIDKIMDALGAADESFFHFSMYILVKAKNLEELENLTAELEDVLGGMKVLFRKTSENMKNALWTVLPFGMDMLGTTRNMLTYGVSNAFPFTNFSFSHKSGFFLGTHKYNLNFTYFDPFQLENANGAILGTSGAGKSVTTKKIMKGLSTVMDIPLRAIDPEGELSPFAKSVNGEVIDYYPGSKHIINIMEPEPDDEIESLIKPQINFLKIYFNKTLDLQKSDRQKIDYSLIYLFNKFGFYDDKETYFDDRRKDEGIFFMGRPKRKPPELYDLLKLWEREELIDTIGETKYLANQLREWTREGGIDMFDGPTTVNFKNKNIFFNLKHLDKYAKEPGVFVLMHKLWDLSRRNPKEKKALITEEAHTLMRNDDMGEYCYDIKKRIRKYGGSSIFVTQNPTDYLKTKWGPEILKNCAWSILMKQKAGEDIVMLKEIYEMLPSEARKMSKFNRNKGECYLVANNFRIPLNIRVSDKELRTFGT